jgi:hypothetical protein
MRSRRSSALMTVLVGAVVLCGAYSSAQIVGPRVLEGRMVGGGSVFTDANDLWAPAGTRITHSLSLNCDSLQQPNNLEIQVHAPNGDRGEFHLDEVALAWCWDDPDLDTKSSAVKFDTLFGAGTGRYNGIAGYCASWHLSDAGEPGTEDRIRSMRIWRPLNGNCAMENGPFIFSIYLEPGHQLHFGNHRALKAAK